MNVSISYQGDVIKFNLFEELMISESKINQEIKDQPSYQGFLGNLLAHLEKKMLDEKHTLKNYHSKYYEMYKKTNDKSTGRPLSNDRVESKIILKPKYDKQMQKVNRLKFEIQIIENCVKSFDARKDLIQSLSANVRRTN